MSMVQKYHLWQGVLKVKTGLQAQTQLFVYGLFIYNQWRGMGTLNSVDVISQHYKLQMDLYVSSYASLAAETIERSMDEGTLHHITINYYNLFLKNRIRYICTVNVSRCYVKVYETIWFYRII